MDNPSQHHTLGGYFALISLGGATTAKWISDSSLFLSGLASIFTVVAAAVSIYFTLRRKKAT